MCQADWHTCQWAQWCKGENEMNTTKIVDCKLMSIICCRTLKQLRWWFSVYRVAQNKPDYLFFVVQVLYFYNKTRKYDNVRLAPKTVVKAGLSVSSTGCNKERQSLVKVSYRLAPLITSWPICSQQVAGLLSGAQRLECDNDGKQAVGELP